jgi:hypothetical protein
MLSIQNYLNRFLAKDRVLKLKQVYMGYAKLLEPFMKNSSKA